MSMNGEFVGSPWHTRLNLAVGHYTEMIEHPLRIRLRLVSYRPPDPNRPELYADAERVLREYQDEYWVVGCCRMHNIGSSLGVCVVWRPLLVDFIQDPDLAEEILNIPYKYHLNAAKKLTKMGVDMIWIGDDVGAQHSMLISPDTMASFLEAQDGEFYS